MLKKICEKFINKYNWEIKADLSIFLLVETAIVCVAVGMYVDTKDQNVPFYLPLIIVHIFAMIFAYICYLVYRFSGTISSSYVFLCLLKIGNSMNNIFDRVINKMKSKCAKAHGIDWEGE